jgi:hypothetical protein
MHLIIYLFVCLLVAFFARHTRVGVLGYFIISLITTPVLSALFLLITKKVKIKNPKNHSKLPS